MKKLFVVLALALNQLFSLDLHGIEKMTGWENLQSGSVSISWCTYDNFPISKAETVLNHSIDRISMAIQDLDHYPDIFDRVTKTNRLDTDVVQIILDMPFPFDGRDYIVKYNIENLDDHWVFVFTVSFNSLPYGPPCLIRLPATGTSTDLRRKRPHDPIRL